MNVYLGIGAKVTIYCEVNVFYEYVNVCQCFEVALTTHLVSAKNGASRFRFYTASCERAWAYLTYILIFKF